MQSSECGFGRSFLISMSDGEDFFEELSRFCLDNEVSSAIVVSFIAGFSHVRIVGTCDKVEDRRAPLWDAVYLENVEAIGAGTIARNDSNDTVSPHIHVSVGQKERGAAGYTSHLLEAKVQFLVEMLILEVATPRLSRVRNGALYNVPLLAFDE